MDAVYEAIGTPREKHCDACFTGDYPLGDPETANGKFALEDIAVVRSLTPPPSDPKDADVSQFRIVVLASGSGTNLQAILNQLHGGTGMEVVGVGSDKPGARALERAGRPGSRRRFPPASTRTAPPATVRRRLDRGREADLVVLAGYMQLLSPEFVRRFRNRVINVHPALLPSSPGRRAQQAIDHGSKITGVTVHFVDEGVDFGPDHPAAAGADPA